MIFLVSGLLKRRLVAQTKQNFGGLEIFCEFEREPINTLYLPIFSFKRAGFFAQSKKSYQKSQVKSLAGRSNFGCVEFAFSKKLTYIKVRARERALKNHISFVFHKTQACSF